MNKFVSEVDQKDRDVSIRYLCGEGSGAIKGLLYAENAAEFENCWSSFSSLLCNMEGGCDFLKYLNETKKNTLQHEVFGIMKKLGLRKPLTNNPEEQLNFQFKNTYLTHNQSVSDNCSNLEHWSNFFFSRIVARMSGKGGEISIARNPIVFEHDIGIEELQISSEEGH